MSRTTRYAIALLLGLGGVACRDTLLHDKYDLRPVPHRVVGAQPYYTQGPQAPPLRLPMPDSLVARGQAAGAWRVDVLPYQGVAVWRIATADTTAEAFYALPGLLDLRRVNDTLLELGRATDTYALHLERDSLRIAPVHERSWRFNALRYLYKTLRPDPSEPAYVHFDCPAPDSTLIGFRLTHLETPSCYFD